MAKIAVSSRKMTEAQTFFSKRVAQGHLPGGAALTHALENNAKVAAAIKREANSIVSGMIAHEKEMARKARAAAARKAEKEAAALAKKKVAWAKEAKKLADKVAGVMNKANDKAAKASARNSLAKLYRELRASIAKKRQEAKIRATGLVRVSDVTRMYAAQFKR